MTVSLTARVSGHAVLIQFGDAMVAALPLSDEQLYRTINTGETEDEIAADVAAEWLLRKLLNQ